MGHFITPAFHGLEDLSFWQHGCTPEKCIQILKIKILETCKVRNMWMTSGVGVSRRMSCGIARRQGENMKSRLPSRRASPFGFHWLCIPLLTFSRRLLTKKTALVVSISIFPLPPATGQSSQTTFWLRHPIGLLARRHFHPLTKT